VPLTLRWFPQSWLQMTTAQGTVISIDPAYASRHFRGYQLGGRGPSAVRGLPGALPPSDLILLTHKHHDHTHPTTIARLLKSDTLIVAPAACRKALNRLAGVRARFVSPGDHVAHLDLHIEAVPAYNTREGTSLFKLHKPGRGVGYLVTTGNMRIYHAGDTDFVPEMRALAPGTDDSTAAPSPPHMGAMHELETGAGRTKVTEARAIGILTAGKTAGGTRLGGVANPQVSTRLDAAFLPIGGIFTMNVKEAAQAASAIRPRLLVPMHRLRSDPTRLAHMLKDLAPEVDVHALRVGEEIRLSPLTEAAREDVQAPARPPAFSASYSSA